MKTTSECLLIVAEIYILHICLSDSDWMSPGIARMSLFEGLNGVKRVAWNVQKISRVSWKREKINRVSWIILVQITVLFVAFPKLWTIIWCMWSIWFF